MCRNIKMLFNFAPPATEAEIRDASLQFVRKLSGFHRPSKANAAAFERATEEIAATARVLLASLVTGGGAAQSRGGSSQGESAISAAIRRTGVNRGIADGRLGAD